MERNSVTCARGNARAYIQKSGVVLLPVLTPSRTSEHRTHARPTRGSAGPGGLLCDQFPNITTVITNLYTKLHTYAICVTGY